MRLNRIVLALASMAPIGAAQCTVTGATFEPYGTGCGAVVSQAPTLKGAFDSTTCTVSLTVDAFGGCCNTFVTYRLLGLGLAPDKTPLPFLGSGCELLIQPLIVVALPPNQDTLKLTIPPGMPTDTVYLQGGAGYLTTIGLTRDLALTQGLRVTLL